MSSITGKQKFHLKKLVNDLGKYRGRHTELVTVYVPEGYELVKIIQHLAQEAGTASNIKSTSTRKNVEAALEKMIQHLRLYKKTPPNGLVVFSGNVSEQEGRQDVRVWSIEPPVPLRQRLYRCDKTFVLDGIMEMMEVKETYGMIVLDRRDAMVALLKGKTIIPLVQTHSEVPGKMRAGGQCCVPGTMVQLNNGALINIEDIHNTDRVKSFVFKNDMFMKDSAVKHKWSAKKSQVFRIVTKAPRLEIETSKDHVFFVAAPEGIVQKPADELTIGDLLIIPEKIEVVGKIQSLDSKKYYNRFTLTNKGKAVLKEKRLAKKLHQRQLAKILGLTQTGISFFEIGKNRIDPATLKRLCDVLDINFPHFIEHYAEQFLYRDIKLPVILNEEFAQFIGYVIGDGCIEDDRITLFEQDSEVAKNLKVRFDKFFGIESSYRFRKSKNYHQLRFTSRPLVRLLRNEFPEIRLSGDSEIPKKILESPDNIVASFLKGLFDADGYVSKKRVALGINNKRLAQQVQLTLLRFSIISSLLEYDNRSNKYSKNHRFTVDISDFESLVNFKKYIGLSSNLKLKKLLFVIKIHSKKSSVRQIVVPGTHIRKLIENAGYNLELFPKVNNFFRDERMMSKEVFRNSILPNVKDKKLYNILKKVCQFPVLPVKINKIEKQNKRVEMIDISVAEQNFIANGIIVHNSAHRFEMNRELAAKAHYKKVADYVKEQFLGMTGLKGILIGGPGPTKYEFAEGGFITEELRRKIIAIKDLGYTGEFGLQELLDRCEDVLAQEDVTHEKSVMNAFFTMLAKEPDKVSYGEHEVRKVLAMGAVDVLLLSEALPDEKLEELEQEAEKTNVTVEIISTETREGVQLRDIGMIAAMLRFKLNF